jgi:predicted esterase
VLDAAVMMGEARWEEGGVDVNFDTYFVPECCFKEKNVMNKYTNSVVVAVVLFLGVEWGGYAQCLNGKWDTQSNIWFKDCTPGEEYDGRYVDAPGVLYTIYTEGEVVVPLGNATSKTVSWRLTWVQGILDSVAPVPDSIPMIVGLHSWEDNTDKNERLGSEVGYVRFDPGIERIIFLTFYIEDGHNSNTWWWGYQVEGIPTPWAEEALVDIIKKRIEDAPQLLAAAGAAELANRVIHRDRVYLRGCSMGGTGTYRLGIKHPELFAAIHAHAGFADFRGPCGPFCNHFHGGMLGAAEDRLQTVGMDGAHYLAHEYTDMSWFIAAHRGQSWEAMVGESLQYCPPYVLMTHGSTDDAVDIASADRFAATMDSLKYGYSYFRHGGGHSEHNFARSDWMLNFRKNRPYFAFSQNSTNTASFTNNLNAVGWDPRSVAEDSLHVEVVLTGSGTADVTPRNLQHLRFVPGETYYYWRDTNEGEGSPVVADDRGGVTVPGVAGGQVLIIAKHGYVHSAPVRQREFSRLTAEKHPKCLVGSMSQLKGTSVQIYDLQGRVVYSPHHTAPAQRSAQSGGGNAVSVYIVEELVH